MKMTVKEGWMSRFWRVVVVGGGLEEEEKKFLTAQRRGFISIVWNLCLVTGNFSMVVACRPRARGGGPCTNSDRAGTGVTSVASEIVCRPGLDRFLSLPSTTPATTNHQPPTTSRHFLSLLITFHPYLPTPPTVHYNFVFFSAVVLELLAVVYMTMESQRLEGSKFSSHEPKAIYPDDCLVFA